MARLSGKTIMVTGAGGAVGSAVCAAIAGAGGSAMMTDLVRRDGVDFALDVTAPADWLRVIADLERTRGYLDGLVNAAGIAHLGNIETTDLAQWRNVMAINLDGVFLGCKHAFSLLRRCGGAIVNLGSIYGHVGNANLVAYTASKGALRLLTKSVALYGAGFKPPVRCNCICPAFLDGAMVDGIAGATPFPNLVKRQLVDDIPLKRLGTAEEVAALCVYLLSDDSAFITGADFPIDGGLTAR